jgi:F-type H+-transporting ATPase subunit gamma
MASLQDLRTRLRGVKATQKITQAMKMVAAAKLKRATDRVHGSQPYAAALAGLVHQCLAEVNAADWPILRSAGADEYPLYVIVGGERGLCGAFNNNLLREVRRTFRRHRALNQRWQTLCLGKKPFDGLVREFANSFLIREPRPSSLSPVEAAELAQKLVDGFVSGRYSSINLIYNHMASAIKQDPTHKALLPLHMPEPAPTNDRFEYSDPKPELLEKLLTSHLAAQLYSISLENAAGEQAARMVAMDNATRNAGKMISRLSLQYNRQRQANITREIIEIVSGAGAQAG